MDQEYSVEERERQIAVLHDRRKKRGKKWRELRPRSLLRAMAVQQAVSTEQVKTLVEAEYSDPVVSLYLRLNPERVVPEPKAFLRSFHSLKTRALEGHKDFIESLSRSQKETLDHDMKEIEAFLADYFVPQNLRSLIIFRSGEKLNRVIRLWVRTSHGLVIDPDLYVVPLEVVLEESERVLFVETSNENSQLLIYQLGYCQQAGRIRSFVPSDTVDASIPGRVQRHRLTHLQWHLRHTASAAYRLSIERSCNALILMAEGRVSSLLEEFLHDSLREKIIGRIYSSPDAETRDRTELIESMLRDHRAAKETKAIEDLANYKPGEELVSSLGDVISASNLFLVRKLLVNESLHQKGFGCKGHHYVSLEETPCPFDGAKLLPVENVVDEIVEIARLHGVNVMIVEHRQDLLARYGGIAAVQYRHLSQA